MCEYMQIFDKTFNGKINQHSNEFSIRDDSYASFTACA